MTHRRADIIRLLEMELNVIEKGGYGRSVREPGKPTEMFRKSVTCINHWFVPAHRTHSCEGCVLLDFVPDKHKRSRDPCHHIPLDETGKTVQDLQAEGQDEILEEAVKNWLRATLKRLKEGPGVDEAAPEVDY